MAEAVGNTGRQSINQSPSGSSQTVRLNNK
jgi:hypothetical protein